MNMIGKRYLYFAISLLVIIPGMLALIIWGLPLAIDFTGGSVLEVKFESGVLPQDAQVIALYTEFNYPDTQVQSSGTDQLIIRSKDMPEATKTQIVTEMEKRFNSKITINQFDSVGPVIGQEVTSRAATAVGLAALGILAYITFAFRGVPHAFRYGTAAIIAMLHDVLVVVGMEALLGHFVGWEADSLFLTALLTVIGFSVHDTIVVFDRIRENQNLYRKVSFERIVNHSMVQTLARSINTQLTVMLCLLAMALFGGITIRHFVTVLLIGVLSGTYSSIFNASPILVVWENQEWKWWFNPKARPKEA
ncbi:MAG: protein translocase subunit SecF [Anaerolineaceae bacterium]|jgi:preprotein translocase subunit SecF